MRGNGIENNIFELPELSASDQIFPKQQKIDCLVLIHIFLLFESTTK